MDVGSEYNAPCNGNREISRGESSYCVVLLIFRKTTGMPRNSGNNSQNTSNQNKLIEIMIIALENIRH